MAEDGLGKLEEDICLFGCLCLFHGGCSLENLNIQYKDLEANREGDQELREKVSSRRINLE
jgi:hypothetical protein